MASTRDYTKYEFEGKQLGKARLVLALVRRFAQEHPSSSFADLLAAFPDSLQADSPLQFDKVQCVVCRLEQVSDASRVRFFHREEDVIRLGGEDILVSREWNLHNIQNFLVAAERLGYKVTSTARKASVAGSA